MVRLGVAIVVCLSLALTRLLGAHMHVEPHHDDATTAGHDHAASHVGFAFEPDHAEAHEEHDAVDATSQDITGKAGTLVALIAVTLALLLPAPGGAARAAPAYHGPPSRRRSHIFPPSQAPPLAS